MIQHAKKFKQWEAIENPCYRKYGEWEVDYEYWDKIYSAFDDWLRLPNFSKEEIEAILYLIARDNECEILSGKLKDYPDVALKLAALSLDTLHSDAKWQIATIIAKYNNTDVDKLLYELSLDRSYYVQRICMMESAKRKSAFTNEMVEWSWLTQDEYQMISALWSLFWINNDRLPKFIEKAKKSEMKYLQIAADEIQKKVAQQGDAPERFAPGDL